jgi:hypothetical protein
VYIGVKLVELLKLPFPLCVQEKVPFAADTPETVALEVAQILDELEMVAVGKPLTVMEKSAVAIAGAQLLLLETVIVRVTMFPKSPAVGV